MSRRFSLSRRAVLRGAVLGAGVSLALPPLEATVGDRAWASSELGPIFGVVFWANGLPWHAGHGSQQGEAGHPDLWTPASTGPGYAPSELLAPLAAYAPSVITGLEPQTDIPSSPGGQGDGHMRGFMVALTSDRPRSEGFDHASHTLTARRPSLDQVVADHPDFYGSQPPRFRSLELGVSTARFHDYGHWNGISYNGPNSQNLPITDPGQLYDLLFAAPADTSALARRSRLLDAVVADASDLQRRLGTADRARVEEHLEHLFEVQRRLDLGAQPCGVADRPGRTVDFLDKTTDMARLLAVALHCNLTRVFSLMLTSPASTHVFSDLGVQSGMHKACHDGAWNAVRDITDQHMQALARVFGELDAAIDPSGDSVLDRSLIYGTSEYGEGWKHGVREMPVLLAGGACGRLARGVHVRAPRGNLSKAHVTLLRALDLPTESYGFNGGRTTSAFDTLLS